MADNLAARLAHRNAALTGRRAAERTGVRSVSVSVITETWSGPTQVSTSTLASTSTLVLSPRPKVVPAGEEPGYFGGGNSAISGGRLIAGTYRVGPITLATTGGGYTVDQLSPPGASNTRIYYFLAGDEFSDGGERFELTDVDASRPHQVTLTVRRTAQ
jgi:hypothetical protein